MFFLTVNDKFSLEYPLLKVIFLLFDTLFHIKRKKYVVWLKFYVIMNFTKYLIEEGFQ